MSIVGHRLHVMKTIHVLPSFVAPISLLTRPSLLPLHRHRCRVFATAACVADNVPTLVIVESPAKALTIQKIVPDHYSVRSCVGHVREIPSSAKRIPAKYKSEPWARLGVDVDNDFRPLYVLIAGKLHIIRELKKELEKSQQLILATDDDREGEAISWHLTEVLKPCVPVKRAVFQEITPEAILHAFSNCRQVDLNLVSAQETRRVLDRLAGYTMSPLLWKKIAKGLSAGRVQSVAMSVIVQREIQRVRFQCAKYSGASATFLASSTPITAILSEINGVRMVKGTDFDDETGELTDAARKNARTRFDHDRMTALCERLDCHNATVKSVEHRETSRHPPTPLITSTLQQECGNRFGFGAGRTMRIAQKLYENGLITYMRTDNPKLSDQAVASCREAVQQIYGKDVLRDQNTVTRGSKRKASQAAHEAIRPAGSKFKEPHELTDLNEDEQSVYSLIFRRTLASQMCSAKLHSTTIRVEVPALSDKAVDVVVFKATGTTVVQAGFLKALQDASAREESPFLPRVHEGMAIEFRDFQVLDHETKPPPRFNDASLVKVLEELGVGRPSTYAGIIEKLITRGYIFRGSSLPGEKKVPRGPWSLALQLLLWKSCWLVTFPLLLTLSSQHVWKQPLIKLLQVWQIVPSFCMSITAEGPGFLPL
ncbi:DNA topoisomerase 1 [Gracilariopsis chorda]|uniref:DNA topoisomerase n=1 Tax=Gracilariopsis chorda TaxID=448386 RepID=A0A2V3ICY5_9FLOR|nr:DNA topoisomerase 1 [Gracilariopsis chorda]|eukprot:PXF39955.1 DNA topoisomerase 1 [Gracilariopsis chorda]